MADDHYKYSSSELSRYYGITRKGLAFYEQKGIVSPRHLEESNFREYSLEDCYSMYHEKLYANCGFTLSEITECIQKDSLPVLLDRIQHQHSELERQYVVQGRMIKHIERIQGLLHEYVENGSQYEIIRSPEFYRLFVRTYRNAHVSSAQQAKEFELWNSVVPMDVASLKFECEDIFGDQEQLNPGIGNIFCKEDFDLLGLEMSENVEYYPSRLCLHTIISCPSGEIGERTWLVPVLKYMEEHNYRCTGPMLTRMLLVASEQNRKIRYDELWVPMDEI